MKFDPGPIPLTEVQKMNAEIARLENWHDFYAILPVRVGPSDGRFLELVERKGTLYSEGWGWKYRAKQ